MRLTQRLKKAVAAARPGATLVRVGSSFGAVWHEPEQPPAERWRSQLITDLDAEGRLWWRPEAFGKTRRLVVEHLKLEADV
jgi:hypothetical protein